MWYNWKSKTLWQTDIFENVCGFDWYKRIKVKIYFLIEFFIHNLSEFFVKIFFFQKTIEIFFETKFLFFSKNEFEKKSRNLFFFEVFPVFVIFSSKKFHEKKPRQIPFKLRFQKILEQKEFLVQIFYQSEISTSKYYFFYILWIFWIERKIFNFLKRNFLRKKI